MRRDGEQKKIHQGNVVELRQHNKTIDMDYFKWERPVIRTAHVTVELLLVRGPIVDGGPDLTLQKAAIGRKVDQ
ncbi:hypothetical protein Y032_0084g1720 [Ancylostoma ceylanicum]|uniref:Uncharacterized protein n=1 Tax=Ancylostoma ceylanicum TaxID=53326 RepID=A0A016TQK4_9BILA|nr:hypothetical protein Y032_0084g1720 [Ancylostoma ceylanicum]